MTKTWASGIALGIFMALIAITSLAGSVIAFNYCDDKIAGSVLACAFFIIGFLTELLLYTAFDEHRTAYKDLVESNRLVIETVSKWLATAQIESTNQFFFQTNVNQELENIKKEMATLPPLLEQLIPKPAEPVNAPTPYTQWLEAHQKLWKLEHSDQGDSAEADQLRSLMEECWEKMDANERQWAEFYAADAWKQGLE
jgi:hypothetical protein